MLANDVSDLAFALRLGGLAREEDLGSETGISRKVAKTLRFAKISLSHFSINCESRPSKVIKTEYGFTAFLGNY